MKSESIKSTPPGRITNGTGMAFSVIWLFLFIYLAVLSQNAYRILHGNHSVFIVLGALTGVIAVIVNLVMAWVKIRIGVLKIIFINILLAAVFCFIVVWPVNNVIQQMGQ